MTHIIVPPERHTSIPYLWRSRCTCGWSAIAPDFEHAREAGNSHLSAEEPFPDLDIDPEPGSGADRLVKGHEE